MLPYGDRRMALEFQGRDDNFKKSFVEFGRRYDVGDRAVEAMLARLVSRLGPWVERVGELGYDTQRTANLQRAMRKRLVNLSEAGARPTVLRP